MPVNWVGCICLFVFFFLQKKCAYSTSEAFLSAHLLLRDYYGRLKSLLFNFILVAKR